MEKAHDLKLNNNHIPVFFLVAPLTGLCPIPNIIILYVPVNDIYNRVLGHFEELLSFVVYLLCIQEVYILLNSYFSVYLSFIRRGISAMNLENWRAKLFFLSLICYLSQYTVFHNCVSKFEIVYPFLISLIS